MMDQQTIGRLMDRWANDGGFREAVRRDPVGAVEGTGIALSDEDKEAIAALDWTLSDEELVSRASHAM